MQMHGGKIHVFSEGEGTGSTFSIDLPICKIERHQQQHAKAKNLKLVRELLRSMISSEAPVTTITGEANSNAPVGFMTTTLDEMEMNSHSPNRHNNQRSLNFPVPQSPPPSIQFPAPPQSQCSSSSMIDHPISTTAAGTTGGVESTNLIPRGLSMIRGLSSNSLFGNNDVLVRPPPSSSSPSKFRKKPPETTNDNEDVMEKNRRSSSITATIAAAPTVLPTPIIQQPHYRILIVDDSPVNRKMVRNFLRDFCEICDEANDGIEALEKFQSSIAKLANLKQQPQATQAVIMKEQYYDLIITDYLMPRMNGLELTEHLRNFGYANPIIGLTGNTESNMIEVCMKTGITKLLIKPIQGKELQSVVRGKSIYSISSF